MITPPDDLTHDQLVHALSAGWDLPTAEISYAPWGFGSHHWLITDDVGGRWFLTADSVADSPVQAAVLRGAMRTAHALRHQARLNFVIAPLECSDGELTITVGSYLVALFPYLEADPPGATCDVEQRTELIIAVHAAPDRVASLAPVEDFVIMDRSAVEAGLDSKIEPAPGPYGQEFADLLHEHRYPLQQAFARYDRIAGELADDRSRWVVTHGEPKSDNTMITVDGPVLIDWDTVRLAPPERDVWMTGAEDRYTAGSGRTIDAQVLDFYRLRWDLDDLSSFGRWFTAPHEATPDTEIGWDASVRICAQLAARFG